MINGRVSWFAAWRIGKRVRFKVMPEVMTVKNPVHISTQMARAMEQATGQKGVTFTVKWPKCQDVPNFLKRFEKRQRRTKHLVLQLD